MDAVLVSSAWRGPEECWSDNPTGVSELWFVGLSQFLLVKGKLGILATVKNGPPPFFFAPSHLASVSPGEYRPVRIRAPGGFSLTR